MSRRFYTPGFLMGEHPDPMYDTFTTLVRSPRKRGDLLVDAVRYRVDGSNSVALHSVGGVRGAEPALPNVADLEEQRSSLAKSAVRRGIAAGFALALIGLAVTPWGLSLPWAAILFAVALGAVVSLVSFAAGFTVDSGSIHSISRPNVGWRDPYSDSLSGSDLDRHSPVDLDASASATAIALEERLSAWMRTRVRVATAMVLSGLLAAAGFTGAFAMDAGSERFAILISSALVSSAIFVVVWRIATVRASREFLMASCFTPILKSPGEIERLDKELRKVNAHP